MSIEQTKPPTLGLPFSNSPSNPRHGWLNGGVGTSRKGQVGIDVRVRDETESGEVRASISDPRMLLPRLLAAANLKSTICVRFIDPYGDAVFNQAQLPALAQELRGMLEVAAGGEARAHLEAVIQLVEAAEGQVHTYVRFVGD